MVLLEVKETAIEALVLLPRLSWNQQYEVPLRAICTVLVLFMESAVMSGQVVSLIAWVGWEKTGVHRDGLVARVPVEQVVKAALQTPLAAVVAVD